MATEKRDYADLIQRLKRALPGGPKPHISYAETIEAADAIAALVAENEALRREWKRCLPIIQDYDAYLALEKQKVAALTAVLQQISDMGPMSVDDQRWRIARDTLEALGIKENAPSV